jgi:hypothetical protein
MPSQILTDGATFTCPHGGAGTVASGIVSISSLADNVTISGHKPILNGAMISGFTTASGCQPPGSAPPCGSFSLPPPSGQSLTIGGVAVYTAADAATIALVPSAGNGTPGLTISEPQELVTA